MSGRNNHCVLIILGTNIEGDQKVMVFDQQENNKIEDSNVYLKGAIHVTLAVGWSRFPNSDGFIEVNTLSFYNHEPIKIIDYLIDPIDGYKKFRKLAKSLGGTIVTRLFPEQEEIKELHSVYECDLKGRVHGVMSILDVSDAKMLYCHNRNRSIKYQTITDFISQRYFIYGKRVTEKEWILFLKMFKIMICDVTLIPLEVSDIISSYVNSPKKLFPPELHMENLGLFPIKIKAKWAGTSNTENSDDEWCWFRYSFPFSKCEKPLVDIINTF